MPNATIDLEILTENVTAGSAVSFNLTFSNTNGERSFNGRAVCDFQELRVYDEGILLSIDEIIVQSLSITARPGILECGFLEDRNGAISGESASYTLEDIDSAIFDGAGPSGLALIGGPWHVIRLMFRCCLEIKETQLVMLIWRFVQASMNWLRTTPSLLSRVRQETLRYPSQYLSRVVKTTTG